MSAQTDGDTVKIDDTYTYVFDGGHVYVLRHGAHWLLDPPGSKAWIAAANEIADLRERVGLADTIAERAFGMASNLEAAGLPLAAQALRDTLKGRS